VPEIIRGSYRYHVSPAKNWPDVAYNFFVDRFGQIWEGRAGSLDGPVMCDATGGSQGYAQLCTFIGNHMEETPTDEAVAAMVQLLAWLGEREGVDTSPGATVEFISRGSNLHPEGAPVVAATISGHRDMSQTLCPGDFAYELVRAELPEAVTDTRRAAASQATTTSTTASTTTAPTTTAPTTSAPTTTPSASTPLASTAPSTPARPLVPSSTGSDAERAGALAAETGDDGGEGDRLIAIGALATGIAGLAALYARRMLRRPGATPSGDPPPPQSG
jgi:hypothetical protein